MSFQMMFINSEKKDKINQEIYYEMKQWKSEPMAGWLLEDAFTHPDPPMTLQRNNISDQCKGKLIFPITFACDILRLLWEGQP